MSRCPHCGSDTPAVPHRVFRLACSACGGPRLPANASFANQAAETVAVRALLRARMRAWRVRMQLRVGGLFVALLTLFMALRLAYTHHLRPGPVIFLAVAWTWFAIAYARRHRRAAWRVRGALEDAHALAGLPSALAAVRVRAAPGLVAEPAIVDAVDETNEAYETDDALADFDRRLAAHKPQRVG